MRENPDTSLKLLRLLADEPHYPSRLTEQEITSQLGITSQETLLHVQCCLENGLMDAQVVREAVLGPAPPIMTVLRIWGLTAKGRDFVRNAEGKWWKRAKEHCAKAGVEATTTTLSQVMALLARTALETGG